MAPGRVDIKYSASQREVLIHIGIQGGKTICLRAELPLAEVAERVNGLKQFVTDISTAINDDPLVLMTPNNARPETHAFNGREEAVLVSFSGVEVLLWAMHPVTKELWSHSCSPEKGFNDNLQRFRDKLRGSVEDYQCYRLCIDGLAKPVPPTKLRVTVPPLSQCPPLTYYKDLLERVNYCNPRAPAYVNPEHFDGTTVDKITKGMDLLVRQLTQKRGIMGLNDGDKRYDRYIRQAREIAYGLKNETDLEKIGSTLAWISRAPNNCVGRYDTEMDLAYMTIVTGMGEQMVFSTPDLLAIYCSKRIIHGLAKEIAGRVQSEVTHKENYILRLLKRRCKLQIDAGNDSDKYIDVRKSELPSDDAIVKEVLSRYHVSLVDAVLDEFNTHRNAGEGSLVSGAVELLANY
ncbi:MAG: hypothetical protein KDK78_07845, partial [Chlamydiia bacterium]|nr:hypothetical protein [Chlamydiia bacterium]